jgi:hypothetical protein
MIVDLTKNMKETRRKMDSIIRKANSSLNNVLYKGIKYHVDDNWIEHCQFDTKE